MTTKKINIIPTAQVSNREDGRVELTIGPKGNQETFTASEFIPGIVLLNIIRQSNSIDENSSDNMVMVNMLYDFFDSVFEGEEQERFYNYCADPSNKIQIPDLFDIFTKMFESYTDGRPTNG